MDREHPHHGNAQYVQRVLENAVVYDMLNPNRPTNRPATVLTSFLGAALRRSDHPKPPA